MFVDDQNKGALGETLYRMVWPIEGNPEAWD
jgi:hypothetical protein